MNKSSPKSFTITKRIAKHGNHSLGPIANSVSAETGNSTLYGMQGHIEWKGIRTEGGVYHLKNPEDEKILVNGIANFTALDQRFGLAWRLSEEDQWYGLAFLNIKGDVGYRLKFTYEPTSEKALRQIVLADGLLSPSSVYYTFSPREWGESMADIAKEYPSAPMFTAGVPESFLPVYMANDKSVMWATHSADTRKNTENLFIESAVYPFAYIPSDDFFKGLFVGGTWNQSRIKNETCTSTTGYFGFKKGPFRLVLQKEEGSKGETSGYVMLSQMW